MSDPLRPDNSGNPLAKRRQRPRLSPRSSDMPNRWFPTVDARTRNLIAQAACAIGMGAIYLPACFVSLSIDVTSGAASVWPASGLLLGVLLLTPDRYVLSILIGTLL